MVSVARRCGWPVERLGEAIEALGRRCGFSDTVMRAGNALGEPPTASSGAPDGSRLEGWVVTAAARLGLEAEPVEAPYPEVERLVRASAPAILEVPDGSGRRFLTLLPGKGRRLIALAPDHALHELDPEELRRSLCGEGDPAAARVNGRGEGTIDVDGLLSAAGIEGRRRERARAALLDELRSGERVGGCWLIRPSGRSSLRHHAREARLARLLTTVVLAHAIYFLLWIVSWWLLGRGALSGQLDHGWLLAWGLILLTLIPFRLVANHASGMLAVRAGALLKRRLLFGALRLDAEEVRHLGTGQLLGRVMESDVVEQAAISGGLLITSTVELFLAGIILTLGAGGWLQALLLFLWVGITVWISRRYLRRRREWTAARLDMTNDIVESMVGHRTRLAQEARERWNEGEDQALSGYYELSRSVDRTAVTLQALVPRGWFIVGMLGLVPAFVGGGPSIASVAIGVGGVILAYQAFKDLVEGMERILAVRIAWEKVRSFWQAASRPEQLGQPGFDLVVARAFDARANASAAGPRGGTNGNAPERGPPEDGAPLLDAQDLVFRYHDRAEPVLRGLDLRIRSGDRILLEGASGGGKSTLGMLLSACRTPDSGLLLLCGLDLETVGRPGWRRRVIIVPQFHDNHVLVGPFLFNLLMGRGWPPDQNDLREADAVCRALGLGPLLDRMPGGLLQPVGETGWQLSHGERSRLFIARALLQRADLVILDESFAALDPENLRASLECVLEKAPALMVIAHP